MDCIAERSQLHLFLFHTGKSSCFFFFFVQNIVCCCSCIDGCFETLKSEPHSNEWSLFIDSSKARLKAVLLISENKNLAILLLHITALKKTLETTKLILHLIKYFAYNWKICSKLKVIGLHFGIQMGCTENRILYTIPNGHTVPNIHNPKWTPSRMDTIPNEHNPEWTLFQMDTNTNKHDSELTQYPNRHHPKLTQHPE